MKLKTCFLSQFPSCDKETLIPIIKDRIKPGITILSDCWKSYDCLEKGRFSTLNCKSLIKLCGSWNWLSHSKYSHHGGKLKDPFLIHLQDMSSYISILLNIWAKYEKRLW